MNQFFSHNQPLSDDAGPNKPAFNSLVTNFDRSYLLPSDTQYFFKINKNETFSFLHLTITQLTFTSTKSTTETLGKG